MHPRNPEISMNEIIQRSIVRLAFISGNLLQCAFFLSKEEDRESQVSELQISCVLSGFLVVPNRAVQSDQRCNSGIRSLKIER
jgi:hypothetical protein